MKYRIEYIVNQYLSLYNTLCHLIVADWRRKVYSGLLNIGTNNGLSPVWCQIITIFS